MTLEEIRAAEARSHTEAYSNHRLFEPGSWLSKPVRTVVELLPLYRDAGEFRCLDLGCGVGRNCIPAAQAFADKSCRVDCVDILPFAIERLQENAKTHGVSGLINPVCSPIEEFEIQEEVYDLILGISALEHCGSEASFLAVLEKIRQGTRPGGCVCLIVNSGVREQDAATGCALEPQFEVNLETGILRKLLSERFSGWNILKNTLVHQQYTIPRGDRSVVLDTDVVTFVARK